MQDKRLFFSSAYPELTVGDEIYFPDLLRCQFEALDVNDLEFAFNFLATRDASKLYVVHSAEGEQCGVIRAVKVN